MVVIDTKVTAEGWPAATKRALSAAMRKALGKAGMQWYRDVMSGHFRANAGARYGYAPRSKRHRAAKRRRFGHDIPLVFTGASERAARAAVRIQSAAKRARVVLPAIPRYFYMQPAGHPDKMGELGRTLPAEDQGMADRYGDEAAKELNALKGVKRIG